MASRLDNLIEKRNKCVTDIRALLEKQPEIIPDEIQTQVKALEAEESKLIDSIETEERQIEREKKLLAVATGSEAVRTAADAKTSSQTASQTEEEKREKKKIDMFRRYLTDGNQVFNHPEFRDLVAGTLTQGGAMIAPQTFLNELLKAIDNQVFIKKMARVIPMSQSVSLGVPTLDHDADDATWTIELATGVADTGMNFGKRELKPWPIAKRIKVTNKLMQVSAIPIESLVQERFAYKFAVAQEKAFMTGSGASQPLGLFTASSMGLSTNVDVNTGNTSSALTFDGLINAKYSVKGQYQATGSWIFHRTQLGALRLLKDGQGRYLWQPQVTAGQPATLLDSPFYMSEYCPNTATTGLYLGIFGDFSKYWIAQVLDFQVQKLVELYAETNQTGWIGRMELDGMPVLEEAFARVKLS